MLSLTYYGSSWSVGKDVVTTRLEGQNSNNLLKLHKSPNNGRNHIFCNSKHTVCFSLKQQRNGPPFSPSICITVAFDFAWSFWCKSQRLGVGTPLRLVSISRCARDIFILSRGVCSSPVSRANMRIFSRKVSFSGPGGRLGCCRARWRSILCRGSRYTSCAPMTPGVDATR